MLRQIAMAACERTKKIIKDKNKGLVYAIFNLEIKYFNSSPEP